MARLLRRAVALHFFWTPDIEDAHGRCTAAPLTHGALLAAEMTPIYFGRGRFASVLGQERFFVGPSWKSWLVLRPWGRNLQVFVQASKTMLNKTEGLSVFDLVPRWALQEALEPEKSTSASQLPPPCSSNMVYYGVSVIAWARRIVSASVALHWTKSVFTAGVALNKDLLASWRMLESGSVFAIGATGIHTCAHAQLTRRVPPCVAGSGTCVLQPVSSRSSWYVRGDLRLWFAGAFL